MAKPKFAIDVQYKDVEISPAARTAGSDAISSIIRSKPAHAAQLSELAESLRNITTYGGLVEYDTISCGDDHRRTPTALEQAEISALSAYINAAIRVDNIPKLQTNLVHH